MVPEIVVQSYCDYGIGEVLWEINDEIGLSVYYHPMGF